MHHLYRRIVDAAILAHLRIVGGQEVFVEVEPGIPLRLLPQGSGIHGGDHALKEGDGGLDFHTRFRVAQDVKRICQQPVSGADGLYGLGHGEAVAGAGEAGQQQRIG